jgi:hypothetical protein
LERFISDDYGTFGRLIHINPGRIVNCFHGLSEYPPPKHLFFTVERPWLNNKPFKSCVPEGYYETEWYNSPKHKRRVLQLKDVLGGREYCQFHIACFPGDVKGCIGLGTWLGKDADNKTNMGVFNSEKSLDGLDELFMDKEIILQIRNIG